MDVRQGMDDEMVARDRKYAMDMIPMLPAPARRYIKHLEERLKELIARDAFLIEHTQRLEARITRMNAATKEGAGHE